MNKHTLLFLVVLGLLSLRLQGCQPEKPIKLGFVGGLTGRSADLGVAGRNGVILAVEEYNNTGGIHGRPIKLLTRDDRQDPQIAAQVDRELIEAGVIAIIGHMNSTMSMAGLPVINEHQVLMLSPTTSTNQLTGLDDYFVRVVAPNKDPGPLFLARHALLTFDLHRMAVVYDLANYEYTKDFYRFFRAEFEKLHQTIVQVETFTSGISVSFMTLADTLLTRSPDGVLIIANAFDTAMLCQHLRKIRPEIFIMTTGWAMTADLIQHGGAAVEGIVSSQAFYKDSQARPFLEFKQRFRARFGHPPGFAATYAYEAATILLDAFARKGDPHRLKASILEQGIFEGLQGPIIIDQYGDAQRPNHLVTVENGRIILMKSYPVNNNTSTMIDPVTPE